MWKWFAIAALAATLAACAEQPVVITAEQPPAQEATLIAASLGYHGPSRAASDAQAKRPD